MSTHLVQREHAPGHTVSLWKRTQRGELLGYTLMVRATSRHAATKRHRSVFPELEPAQAAFARTIADPGKVMRPTNTVENLIPAAEAMILRGKSHTGPVTLPQLFVLSRVRSTSKNKAYFATSEAYCRILARKLLVPSPFREDVFLGWVRECLGLLLTTATENDGKVTRGKPMGVGTIRRRVQFLSRALNNLLLDRNLFAHGRAYAALVTGVPAIAKDVVRVGADRATPTKHFEPLTTRQVEEMLNAAPTLALVRSHDRGVTSG